MCFHNLMMSGFQKHKNISFKGSLVEDRIEKRTIYKSYQQTGTGSFLFIL